MDVRRPHLRLLAVQTTSSMSSEVSVFHTLLKGLLALSREQGIEVDVLLVQGIEGNASTVAGRGAALCFRRLPNVAVYELNVGKLGQHDSSRLDRVLKVRDLAAVRLARKRLFAKVCAFQPHVVYSAQQIWDLRLAGPLAHGLGCPRVTHLHYNVGPALGPGIVETLRQAHMVIAVSDFIRDDAIAHGVASSRAHTLYNSVAVPEAPLPDERLAVRQDVRAELGLSADALLVGMVARLSPSKGQPQLLEAMLGLLKNDRRVHLVLAGSEFPARNGMADALRQTARVHSVLSQVHLLGQRGDVPRLLGALDLFAHPARQEPCGLAVLEAAAHGLPVVAWREGGPATLVRDQETGLLIEPMDMAGLTDALRTLIADQDRRVAMGTRGRERVARRFNPKVAAASFLSLLEMAANRELEITHRAGNLAAGVGR
jgi:glycosyltransferase involved in cell wall biosynthesis